MTDETRTLKRRHLVYYLEVYDDEANELLGHLVDLTTSGLKLVSKQRIPTNRNYKLRMMLPEGYFSQKDLYFEAQSMWSANDINPDFYDTGFAAPKIDPAAQNIIRDLVSQVSFND
ncbi:MAG: PilZ domain-containing protein [Desulfurivibrio sp.]|nr:PilZ domain-containing protein [Desulfurivibrio sp.]MBU3936731.1 PilZ domain-containing protein [Pseudomonadota bacterium]MBU4033568.1 PilZ domain-containing protein [Pseudomonadota bacterium]MBU4117199.1 PilZ domain-containing protein [Pseudomonadota bacterium]